MNLRPLINELRPHQWSKNLLVYVPMVMDHRLLEFSLWSKATIAFFALSFLASATYIINDIIDLEADKSHPQKSKRPLASGVISLPLAVTVSLLLAISGLLGAYCLSFHFLIIALLYSATSIAYSCILKRLAILDTIILALLYCLRIFAGGIAVGILVSKWLLAFSMFLFLSLAFVKRVSEFLALREQSEERTSRRGYRTTDIEQLTALGSASGYISVLVLALYISSKEIESLYAHPMTLWAVCPLLLYWLGRIWLITNRGEMNEDPIVFAITDATSYIVGLIAAIFVFIAS